MNGIRRRLNENAKNTHNKTDRAKEAQPEQKKEPHKNAYAGLKCLRCARQLATITPDIALLIFFLLSLSCGAQNDFRY